MSLGKYEGPGEIQYNNRTLAEAMSVSITHNPNNNRVYTMKKGLAGRSRGAYEAEISVENAVPKAGLEQDFIAHCIEDADVTISVLYAGKTYIYEGFIDSVDQSQATDAAATLSFTVVAGKPRIL